MNRACERYFQEDVCEPDNTTVRQAYYAGFRRAHNSIGDKAEWKPMTNMAICTNCDCVVDKYISIHYDFCPRCGLRMWENKKQ